MTEYKYIARAREEYDDDRVDTLLEYTERALRERAKRYDIEDLLDEDAIKQVQDGICSSLVDGDDDPMASAANLEMDTLLDDMEDPESTSAITSIAFITGMRSHLNSALREFSSRVVAQNYMK